MYVCSKCNLGVLVRDLETPIRACNCMITVVIDGVEITRPAPIITLMDSRIEGKSSLTNGIKNN